jgi:Putative DNA-binding domain
MSNTLAAQQIALLDMLQLRTIDLVALRADSMPASGHISFKNPAFTVRGLRAYRANAQELSVQALQASYPTLQQLLGEENFIHLAQGFWQTQPPERGDLAQWGQGLAVYLAQVPQLQDLLAEHAYLTDVARVEWALHVAATASDAAMDAQSFSLLTSHDPAQLRLMLSPGSALVQSAYPVMSIVQLHDARFADVHAAARGAIAEREPQTALVWRQGLRPMLGHADAASAALIEAALQGQSLSEALDVAMAQTTDFDFSTWLAQSVRTGLLVGVR